MRVANQLRRGESGRRAKPSKVRQFCGGLGLQTGVGTPEAMRGPQSPCQLLHPLQKFNPIQSARVHDEIRIGYADLLMNENRMMINNPKTWSAGVAAAIGAASLFGAGTPLAKLLLDQVSPWLLAGLFYLGSGVGLTAYRLLRRSKPVALPRKEWPWLIGAIACGGVIGPVLLMFGLTNMPASGASLLLNAEGVFTALLAWFAFRENFDRRIAAGMLLIVCGALVLSWPSDAQFAGIWPAVAVLGACLAWGIDNNLTRKVSLSDATWIASVKGLVAGAFNVALALAIGAKLPDAPTLAGAMVVGCLAYGVSLTLFIVGLQNLGTARTGAYFCIAPFFGAVLSIPLLNEPVTLQLVFAGGLMAVGIGLHLTEKHNHEHQHDFMEHDHAHSHDAHHLHHHGHPPFDGKHSHLHQHQQLMHGHHHFPDAHHQHEHS